MDSTHYMKTKTLWFSLGTAGELIKLYPLMALAEERGIPWFSVSTGQSGINLKKQWKAFRLPENKWVSLLETGEDLKTSKGALQWFARIQLLSKGKILKKIHEKTGCSPRADDFWIVHGDTLSTLVGARISKKLKVPLVHVEAGLRSSSLFEPFPEEINRRLVSRSVAFHFPQDQHAENNLKKAKVKGRIFPTHANTLLDALHRVLNEPCPVEIPQGEYAVANLHRFENLTNASRWNTLVETLVHAAATVKVLFVLHAPTEQKLNAFPEDRKRLLDAGVELFPRLPFHEFIHLLARSKFVLSDGGSNQEECFYLGKPCLILRDYTERLEGLDSCCVLSRFQPELISGFLSNPILFQKKAHTIEASPSEIILNTLLSGALS